MIFTCERKLFSHLKLCPVVQSFIARYKDLSIHNLSERKSIQINPYKIKLGKNILWRSTEIIRNENEAENNFTHLTIFVCCSNFEQLYCENRSVTNPDLMGNQTLSEPEQYLIVKLKLLVKFRGNYEVHAFY